MIGLQNMTKSAVSFAPKPMPSPNSYQNWFVNRDGITPLPKQPPVGASRDCWHDEPGTGVQMIIVSMEQATPVLFRS